MPDTLALRRRIKTAQNISKTTRAMQMIAASKLKRAQAAVVASRPYVEKLSTVAYNLAPKNNTHKGIHPYMQSRKTTEKTLYVIISPDKGLCGGMNTNLIREYLTLRNTNALFVTVGKKIQGPVASMGKNLLASFPFGSTLPSFSEVLPLVTIIKDQYLQEKVDAVKIIATHFNTVFSQVVTTVNVLPVLLEPTEKTAAHETLFEPSKSELLASLLERYIEMVVFQQFLETYASYNAAQMIAMQNATNNAKDIVSNLQLLYNKARQEKITNEILDISSASVAIAGR